MGFTFLDVAFKHVRRLWNFLRKLFQTSCAVHQQETPPTPLVEHLDMPSWSTLPTEIQLLIISHYIDSVINTATKSANSSCLYTSIRGQAFAEGRLRTIYNAFPKLHKQFPILLRTKDADKSHEKEEYWQKLARRYDDQRYSMRLWLPHEQAHFMALMREKNLTAHLVERSMAWSSK